MGKIFVIYLFNEMRVNNMYCVVIDCLDGDPLEYMVINPKMNVITH